MLKRADCVSVVEVFAASILERESGHCLANVAS
jgi:hypothetical protein